MIEARDGLRDADQRGNAMLQDAAQTLHGLRLHEIDQDWLFNVNFAIDRVNVVHTDHYSKRPRHKSTAIDE
jgi:ribosomal protein L30/L7E